MTRHLLIHAAAITVAAFAPTRADTLLGHNFGGGSAVLLNGIAPDTNVIRPVKWNAGTIIAANGQVNDGTNTDQGAVFDLGLSWKFKPQSTYKVTLGFTNLDNAIVFAGFRTASASGSVQAQTQGTSFSLRVREITGSDNIGLFQFPNSVFTNAPEFTYTANAVGSFSLMIQTNNLTDAVVSVGTAQVTVNLSTNLFRYFFIGYEDPTTTTPASDAKFTSVVLEGPLPDPLPMPSITSVDRQAGQVTVAWPTLAGGLYCLQGSADLSTWSVLGASDTTPFTGTGDPKIFVDPRSDARYFYRLIRP